MEFFIIFSATVPNRQNPTANVEMREAPAVGNGSNERRD
jgi:hypothetical protein